MRAMTLPISTESFKYYLDLTYSSYDCYGLLKLFYMREFSIELEDEIYITPDKRSLTEMIENRETYSNIVEKQKNNFTKVSTPQYGDVVLIRSWGIPAHVGIFLEKGHFLHTRKSTGACVEKINNWNKRILGYYRHD